MEINKEQEQEQEIEQKIEENSIPNIDQETLQKLHEYLQNLPPPSGEDSSFSYFDNLKDPSEFDDPNTPKKLIECAHEIIFNITAHVMTEDEKGEVTSSVEICTKNYHIPVPFNKDYKSYMSVFFDHLENSIINTISDTNDKAEETKND
jgi:hypothetical protein